MAGETSAKYKVSSDEAASSSSTQNPSLKSIDHTNLEDAPSDASDSDAEIDLILQASAALIKAPEGEKPAQRRPWAQVRAKYFSNHRNVEASARLVSEEAHAKAAQHVDGQDIASQSKRPCQNRLDRKQFLSAPTPPARKATLELSQKVTVTEIRSKLPSLGETSKPDDSFRDSEYSHSFSDSFGFSPKTTSTTQYSMLRFNATPTLSTTCGPAKMKRPCSARKHVTKCEEARVPALNPRSLNEPEATPPDTMESFGQEATLAARKGVTECEEARTLALNPRSLTEPEATPPDTMESVGQEATLSARKRVTKSGEARIPALNPRSLTESEATPPDTMESFEQETTLAARKPMRKCSRRSARNSRSSTEPEAAPEDTMESVEQEATLAARKPMRKCSRRSTRNSRSSTEPEAAPEDTIESFEQEATLAARKPMRKCSRRSTRNSRSCTEPEAAPPDNTESVGQEATFAETMDSFRNMSSSEARGVLNNFMLEALSARAPPVNYFRRRSS